MSSFVKATKNELKARVALDGPTGSGKTFTALTWATMMGKRVAVVDTERGRARLYSDRFDFDVAEVAPPFTPDRLSQLLRDVDTEGYDVAVVDSMSHFWEGEGGVLDIVDSAAQRAQNNSFAGWKVGTPALRHLIDTMLGMDAHLIVTMRSKMEYVLEKDDRTGKTAPKRVGMAPVMRAGVEYEFDLVGDMDLEHRLIVSKSRCSELADAVIAPGRAGDAAEAFLAWLQAGEPMAAREDVESIKADLAAIPDAEARMAAKREFAELFGMPDALTAARVEDARSFVADKKAAIGANA